jgi:crotonobetainyl-CoA:carnitine CoA-transferase CaiB-like acyl-CoA transferase
MGGPLEGLKVIDLATVVAGPTVTRILADLGADVVKCEHPRSGDPVRALGWSKDGVSLWWKVISRNKQPVTLDASRPGGQDLLRRLVADADVLVESFRPGTLERWQLSPESLLEINPRLVVLRVSGFGQTGPYSRRPGFGTLAESLSGYAGLTGFPEGPPVLPPVALADEVTGQVGAWAVLAALWHRDARGGTGQVIDLSLYESLFSLLGPLATAYDALGEIPARIGNRIAYAAPRGTFRSADGQWLGLSGTSQPLAERVLRTVGRADLIDDPRFATNNARLANVDALDAIIQEWVGRRTAAEVLAAFEEGEAAIAPVYDIAQIAADPHYAARGSIARINDDEMGQVSMAAVAPRFSATPSRLRHAGRARGAANDEVFARLGLTPDELARLVDEGAI